MAADDDTTLLATHLYKYVPQGLPETVCWPWQGALGRGGYGHFRHKHVDYQAHRTMFLMTYGPIPPGLFICHHCDNPPCCNPSHLYLGTNADNAQDAKRKGRTATGDRNGMRRHPERRARGDNHGARLHPERVPRGDAHYTHQKPELIRRGDAHPNSKITEQDVRAIRVLHAEGITYREIAARYGLSSRTVWGIVQRQDWKHI
jgi:predicted DNA-binding protein (UPF0251 family)